MRVADWIRQFGGILVGIGLLLAVYLLPPDTSLAELRRSGVLPVCVPSERQPLITGDPGAPGVEAELLAAVAGEIGVRLVLQEVPEMGQDFDPRSWRITRARCALLGGGVVNSAATRSFLDVSPAYAETGWVVMTREANLDLSGRPVGVLASVQGFNRIALSRWLREKGVKAVLVRTPVELVRGLETGRFDAAITEALLGRSLAAGKGWAVDFLPPPLERYPLVIGLWKGDLTLKRAIARAFDTIRTDGRLDAILQRYAVAAT